MEHDSNLHKRKAKQMTQQPNPTALHHWRQTTKKKEREREKIILTR
jgi:hypothetical protein